MKIVKYILGSSLMIALLTSCGGNSDPNSVTLEIKPELGELAKYMSIDGEKAKLSLSELSTDGDTYMKLSSTIQVNVSQAVASNYGFDLDTEFLDADMNRVAEFVYYDIESKRDNANGKYDEYLPVGTHRAVIDETVLKSKWDNEPQAVAMWEMIRTKAKYVVLKPRWDSAKYVPYNGSGSDDSSSDATIEDDSWTLDTIVPVDEVATVSGSSQDWDSILNEYETYCNKLVNLAKKAKTGDVSAVTEYASVLESTEKLQTKLDNAKSDMTAAQAARLNKIAAKMAQSMM